MNTTFSEKVIAYLTLLSGLTISVVAVYYSVSGLTAIFAAATIPIIVMGVALEVSKIIASVWLKQNWTIAPKLIKIYLSAAVAVLMLITSMGIFGFLSKAHLDQNMPTANISAQVALLDEKLKTERETIESARAELKQMSTAVDQAMSRSTDERGADKSSSIRKSQQRERAALMGIISQSQQRIVAINLERAPMAVELRKVEAEVGPIKYIAAFFYGTTDSIILEKAVTWVIILIIVVFDPLALILLVASQVSFQNMRQRKLTKEDPIPIIPRSDPAVNFAVIPDIVHSRHGDPFDFTKHPYLFTNGTPPNLVSEVIQPQTAVEVVEPELELVPMQTEEPVSVDVGPPAAEPAAIDAESTSNQIQSPKTTKVFPRVKKSIAIPASYVQNEEQTESNRWTGIAADAVNDIIVNKSP